MRRRRELSLGAALIPALLCACAVGVSVAGASRDEPMGRWEITPRRLVAGDETSIRLRYTNGPAALPPGSSFSMDVEPISVSQLQYGPISETLEADPEAPGGVRASVAVSPPDDSGFMPVRVTLPEGMAAGGAFTLRFGNKQVDGRVVALVNPTPVHDLAWNVRYRASRDAASDADVDWGRRGWWRELPRVDITPGPATAVRATAPSVVGVGKPFRVRLAVTDRFDGRPDPPFVGKVRVGAPLHLAGLPKTVSFGPSDGSVRVLSGVRASRPGVYRIGVTILRPDGDRLGASQESNPIVADVSGTKPIYWGVLNGRAGYTEGWGDGADSYFRYGREIAGLDYLALSEPVGAAVAPARQAGGRSNDDRSSGGVGGLYACRYGRYLSADEVLRTTLDAARRHHRSGEFVTVAGYMGSTEAAGPHGVYWADPGGHGGDMVPKRMLGFPFEIEHALGATEALVVHHLNAGYLPYSSLSEGRTRAGAVQSPVIECYSDQGMAFPGPGPRDPMVGGVRTAVAKSLFRVIGRGLRFGLVGDSGTLTGWPGRRYPCGVSRRGRFLQGLTACRATALSREAILRAYRARDVYATTGERISLSFTVGGVGMGRAVRSDGPLTATVVVAGTAPISEINLFNGERVLSQARVAGKRDARVVFDLPTPKAAEMPYLVEVVQTDRHRAWSSPIWVQKRSAPDLAWKVGPKGSLILRNAGSAPTSRIVLRGHRTAYGFVRPGWKPEPKVVEGADGQVWLRRWTDTRATLFVVWRGARMDGTLRLEGHAAYDPEPFLSLFAKWSDSAPGGTFRDDGKGLMEFADGSAANRGLGVNVTVSSKRACVARLTTAREVALRVDGHTERGREFTIALNRYADGGRTVVVPALAPGAQYAMPDASLCWMADPDNAIAEISESNNLWTPSARK